jgi:hypothetical protein
MLLAQIEMAGSGSKENGLSFSRKRTCTWLVFSPRDDAGSRGITPVIETVRAGLRPVVNFFIVFSRG